jgi:ferredoxin--NADP+ reductase
MLDNGQGAVGALEVENNALVIKNGDTRASSLGVMQVLDVDTVVFAIGDKVDDIFGLPVQMNEFVKNPNPRFPVDGLSYESFDPETGKPIDGIFVAGWSRKASSGLVGLARKDGENGAQAILEYLKTLPPNVEVGDRAMQLATLLNQACNPLVTREDLKKLEAYEQAEAERLHLEDFKLKTNEEMLAAMGLA